MLLNVTDKKSISRVFFSFSLCGAARLIEMIQVSYFAISRVLRLWCVILSGPLSSRARLPVLILIMTSYSAVTRTSPTSDTEPHKVHNLPSVVRRNASEVRKSRAQACLCINWLELGEFRDENLIPSDSRSQPSPAHSPICSHRHNKMIGARPDFCPEYYDYFQTDGTWQ